MMFEELKLLGRTEKSIVVQTRKGTPIENILELEPKEPERRKYRLLCEKYGGPSWKERKPATGVYNCAGHVWASRRTSILDTKFWTIILEEDGYRLLGVDETPWVGDLAIYVDEKTHDYLHVGMIIDFCDGVSEWSPKIPRVLSKWNSTSGEVFHLVNDVPYGKQEMSSTVEYWTDRPLNAKV